jgi:hypothetical protein
MCRFRLGPAAATFIIFSSSLAAQGFGGSFSPELMRFLQLTPEQATAIGRLDASWKQELQALEQRAGQLRGNLAGRGGEAPAMDSLCREATTARQDLTQKTRALLTKDQLARLQLLEDALNLFPRVLEAQSAGLLPDSLATAPIGLPAGQITVELSFTATPTKPLPGCPVPKTEIRPGIVPGR